MSDYKPPQMPPSTKASEFERFKSSVFGARGERKDYRAFRYGELGQEQAQEKYTRWMDYQNKTDDELTDLVLQNVRSRKGYNQADEQQDWFVDQAARQLDEARSIRDDPHSGQEAQRQLEIINSKIQASGEVAPTLNPTFSGGVKTPKQWAEGLRSTGAMSISEGPAPKPQPTPRSGTTPTPPPDELLTTPLSLAGKAFHVLGTGGRAASGAVAGAIGGAPGERLKTAISYAKQAALSPSDDNEFTFKSYLQGEKAKIQQEAMEKLRPYAGVLDPKEFREITEELYTKFVKEQSDSLLLEHPQMADLFLQIFGDPFTYVSPAKIVGAISKIMPETATAAQGLTQVAKEKAAPFRYMGYAAELERKGAHGVPQDFLEHGSPVADDMVKAVSGTTMASRMRLSPDMASGLAKTFENDSIQKLKIINAVGGDDKVLLHRVANGDMTIEEALGAFDLPPGITAGTVKNRDKFVAAIQANKELSAMKWKLMEDSGMAQYWSEEGLADLPKLENYAPRRLFSNNTSLTDAIRKGTIDPNMIDPVTGDLITGAQHVREKETRGWKADLGAQWHQDIKEFLPKLRASATIKDMVDTAGEKGFLVHLPEGQSPHDAAKALREESGVDWVEVSGDLKPIWNRLTGEAGVKQSAQVKVMAPRAVVSSLTSTIRAFRLEPDETTHLLKQINSQVIKPVNKAAAWAMTAANPMFTMKNAAGAISLLYANRGVRGLLDIPVLEGAAKISALESGVLPAAVADKLIQGTVSVGTQGRKMPTAEVIKILREANVVGQLAERLGAAPGESTVNKVFGKAETLVKKVVSIGGITEKGARGTEDFQHAVMALHFLEPDAAGKVSKDAIAKMADDVTQYAGNYARMSTIEQRFVADQVIFYGWARFSAANTVKNLYRNPGPLLTTMKAKSAATQEFGAQSPMASQEGTPDWMLDRGFPAPLSDQSPTFKQLFDAYKNEKGELPPPGSTAWAYMVVESPDTLALGAAKMLDSMGAYKIDENASAAAQLAPVWSAIVSLSTRQGQTVGESLVTSGKRAFERPTKPFQDMYKFFVERGRYDEAERWKLQLRLYNELGPLGMIPDYLDDGEVNMPGLPGFTNTYAIEPGREVQKSVRTKKEGVSERAWGIRR